VLYNGVSRRPNAGPGVRGTRGSNVAPDPDPDLNSDPNPDPNIHLNSITNRNPYFDPNPDPNLEKWRLQFRSILHAVRMREKRMCFSEADTRSPSQL
jgi:hypothetical protein